MTDERPPSSDHQPYNGKDNREDDFMFFVNSLYVLLINISVNTVLVTLTVSDWPIIWPQLKGQCHKIFESLFFFIETLLLLPLEVP